MLGMVAGAVICLNVSIRTCCIEKKVRKGVLNSPEKVIVEKGNKNINESKDTNQKNQKRRDENKFETQTFPLPESQVNHQDLDQMQNHFLLKQPKEGEPNPIPLTRIQYH